MVALRADGRYAERLVRATLDPGHGEAVVCADGSYIITGGLGGLGTVVTRWLVDRGAGRIVLNGRSEPSDAQRADLDKLAGDTEIVFVAGDIATPGVAEELVEAAEQTGRPLRGLVHGAGVTGDGLVAALTREGMERVWAPKVAGALRLNAVTVTRELDWWVGFSSMATLLGLPGQLAYATGNAWLDALVAWRRASGLPATAINWGQWSGVGMSKSLTYSVLDPITPTRASRRCSRWSAVRSSGSASGGCGSTASSRQLRNSANWPTSPSWSPNSTRSPVSAPSSSDRTMRTGRWPRRRTGRN